MSEKTAFWLVFLSSTLCSLGGLALGVVNLNAPDAGLGGDVGAAIALAFLFVTRDYGDRVYEVTTVEIPAVKAVIAQLKTGVASTPADTDLAKKANLDLAEKFDALVDAVKLDGQGRVTENRFMAVATCVSILISGFGEKIATYIIHRLA